MPDKPTSPPNVLTNLIGVCRGTGIQELVRWERGCDHLADRSPILLLPMPRRYTSTRKPTSNAKRTITTAARKTPHIGSRSSGPLSVILCLIPLRGANHAAIISKTCDCQLPRSSAEHRSGCAPGRRRPVRPGDGTRAGSPVLRSLGTFHPYRPRRAFRNPAGTTWSCNRHNAVCRLRSSFSYPLRFRSGPTPSGSRLGRVLFLTDPGPRSSPRPARRASEAQAARSPRIRGRRATSCIHRTGSSA
jgi:hypothetical protein